jgi:hypothetical protein
MIWFTLLACVLVLGRLIWLGDYLRRCLKAADGHGFRKAWSTVGHVRMTTTSKLEGLADDDSHQETIGISERQLDTSLVGGSVALAAWTQLFASSAGQPGSSISGTSLSLLFTGALVLIAAPMLFRTEGVHLTYIGRAIGSHGGFGLVILSLLSMVTDLVPGFVAVVAVVTGTALVARDSVEVVRHLQLQRAFAF